MMSKSSDRARYIMIGGFLGAGKTTAIARLGKYIVDRGLRAGLISNDQSTGLVDTALLRAKGFDVEEISGGCFCCRFDSLVDAAKRLSEATRPDVFLAEPVGSCTDLVATVSYPLRRIYGDRFTIAPLSVLVDPTRCAKVLGLLDGRNFSSKVVYVYRKQLEEASFIIINKIDTIETALCVELKAALCEAYPKAEVLMCSARNGLAVDGWFDRLLSEERDELPTMAVDYDRYAEGEALLGWLNATYTLRSRVLFCANELLLGLADEIKKRLRALSGDVAHLKMTLVDESGNLSVVSLVGNDELPDLRESLFDQVDSGTLVINLRGEVEPDILKTVTIESLNQCVGARSSLSAELDHLEHFRPGKPEPQHRVIVTK